MQRALVHLPVDLGRVQVTGRLHAFLSFHLSHQRIGQGDAMRIIQVHVILAGGIGQLEVGQDQVSQIFVHIKGGVFGVKAAEQHQAQSQGADHRDGALFVAPQVGPGHRGQGSVSAVALGFLLAGAVGVAHAQGLNGRYFSGEPCGPQAGDQHCHPGKDRRANEDDGAGRNHGLALYCPHEHRHQHRAQQPAQNQTDGDADDAEPVGLPIDQFLQLLGGRPQGFQLTIKLHIGGHADLEDVVDNQVSGNEYQHHAQIHGHTLLGGHRPHLRGVGQVDIVFKTREAGIRQDAVHRRLNVLVACQIDLYHI